MGVGLQAAGTLEEAQKVGLEALIQYRLIRDGLVKGDDRPRSGTKLGGQAGANVLHAGGGEGMEIGFQSFSLGLRLGLRETGKP